MDNGAGLGMESRRKETLQSEVLFQTARCVLQRVTGSSATRVNEYSQKVNQTFAGFL